MEKIDQILDSLYDRVIEPIEAKEQLLDLFAVIKSVCDECTAYPFDERGKTPLCKTCKDNPSQDDYVLWLEQQLRTQVSCLAKKVIEILDKKCRKGCTDPTWVGFQNGNGSECGIDIERLIKQAKRLIFTLETKKQ